MLFVAVYVSVCGLLKERNLFAFIYPVFSRTNMLPST